MSKPPDKIRYDFDRLWTIRDAVMSPHDILIQAKAMLLCALPYRPVPDRQIERTAMLGKETELRVTFTALGRPGLPYGADRALLAWIQTQAYPNGTVSFDSLSGFFKAFGLDDGGRNYDRFNERLERLQNLAVSIVVEGRDEKLTVNTTPVKVALTPKTAHEARRALADEIAGQVLMVPRKYGFKLDPDFWDYLKGNPVPMPLPLMREFHDEPKAWDFTQIVLYRCFAARSPSVFPWDDLVDQLGSQDKNRRQLKYTLSLILKRMRIVYPDLPAFFPRGYEGLKVGPWRPPEVR